jgi:putative PIN family toxin of toxin-antitoxin system
LRVVLDTNVLVSALLNAKSPPGQVLELWRRGRFELLSCEEQIEEFRRVTRYGKIRQRLPQALAGRLVNELRSLAAMVRSLTQVDLSADPWDNFLLGLAQSGHADFLVTGDKAGLLDLHRHGSTMIISVRHFLEQN